MKVNQSKRQATRELVKVSIDDLYQAVSRLQSEMAILYHLHSKELEDMQKIHDNIAEEVTKKAEEAAKQHVEQELLNNEQNQTQTNE